MQREIQLEIEMLCVSYNTITTANYAYIYISIWIDQ